MKKIGSAFRQRTQREPTQEDGCPGCGRRFERLRDPLGRWFVCVRCGVLTGLADRQAAWSRPVEMRERRDHGDSGRRTG
jgi:hypothetical protein